jgi:hypothetical protein
METIWFELAIVSVRRGRIAPLAAAGREPGVITF